MKLCRGMIFGVLLAGQMFAAELPNLIRSYTIQGTEKEVPNQIGGKDPFKYEGKGPVVRDNRIVLDEDCYKTSAPVFPSNQMSVTLWVKPFEMGTGKGNANGHNGMIVCCGSGYYAGWRLYLQDWDSRKVTFQIGQKKGAFGFNSILPVEPAQWNHVAATWDGSNAVVYVNGIKAGSRSHQGNLQLLPPDGALRIGFAGAGVGSLKMSVRSLKISDRAWPIEAIVSDMLNLKEFPPSAIDALHNVQCWKERSSPDATLKYWKEIATADPALRDWAKVSAMKVAARDTQIKLAKQLYENKNLSPTFRGCVVDTLVQLVKQGVPFSAALLEQLPAEIALDAETQRKFAYSLASAYLREKKEKPAFAIYEQMLGFDGLMPKEEAALRMRYAEALCNCGKIAEARTQLKKIQESMALPYATRNLVALTLARTWEIEKQWDVAAKAYRDTRSLPEMKPHLQYEAERCAVRCERMRDGKPADDPNEGRKPLPPLPKPAILFFVAPDGDDRADGSIRDPFATLERARDAVNAKKRNGMLPPGGATVFLRGGQYVVTNTFHLTEKDSGSYGAPIVYRAWKHEKPILDGGFEVHKFSKVKNPKILERLPEVARKYVRRADVKAQGYDALRPQRAFGRHVNNKVVRELFENAIPMRPARWPNHDTIRIKHSDGTQTNFQIAVEERFKRWTGAKDLFANGYWRHLWWQLSVPVKSVNPQNGQVVLAESCHEQIRENHPIYFFNLLEELDQPGEWYLDRETGILYMWPQRHPWFSKHVLSRLSVPFVQADGAREVTFYGLIFAYGQQHAFVLNKCINMQIVGCEVCCIGGSALIADECPALHVYGNRFRTLGHSGISVSGGDRRSLSPSRIEIENNEVCSFARCTRTYNPAVWANGCAIRIAHNYFHDAPSSAMSIGGNDHLIEFNRIERVVLEADDQGGIDMWGNPTFRGNVIRYNLWRDFGGGDISCGQAGIRLDDAISGTVIYGNRFERTSAGNFGAVQIHGGQRNIVDNNIIIDCKNGISFSPWGSARWTNFLHKAEQKLYKDVNIRVPPYSKKYPELAKLWSNPDINSVWRNTFVGSEVPYARMPPYSRMPLGTNLWANLIVTPLEKDSVPLQRPLCAPIPPAEMMGCYQDPRKFH